MAPSPPNGCAEPGRGAVPYPDVAMKHLAFKLVARMAVAVFEKLLLDEFEHPLPCLCIDLQEQPEERAARLLDTQRTPECLLDSWTADMLHRFPSAEALCSPEAAAERQMVLLAGQMCIGRIESRHSSVRRLVKMSSLQSTTTSIVDVSANFILNEHRQKIAAEEETPAKQQIEGQQEDIALELLLP